MGRLIVSTPWVIGSNPIGTATLFPVLALQRFDDDLATGPEADLRSAPEITQEPGPSANSYALRVRWTASAREIYKSRANPKVDAAMAVLLLGVPTPNGYAARRTSFNATLSFAFRFLTR